MNSKRASRRRRTTRRLGRRRPIHVPGDEGQRSSAAPSMHEDTELLAQANGGAFDDDEVDVDLDADRSAMPHFDDSAGRSATPRFDDSMEDDEYEHTDDEDDDAEEDPEDARVTLPRPAALDDDEGDDDEDTGRTLPKMPAISPELLEQAAAALDRSSVEPEAPDSQPPDVEDSIRTNPRIEVKKPDANVVVLAPARIISDFPAPSFSMRDSLEAPPPPPPREPAPAPAEEEPEGNGLGEFDVSESDDVESEFEALGSEAPEGAEIEELEVDEEEEEAADEAAETDEDDEARRTRTPPPPPPDARAKRPPPPPPGPGGEAGREKQRRVRQWWERFFSDDYLMSVLPPTEAQIARQVDFIESSLGLRRGATVLDVGCGLGLHSLELSRRGHLAVGLDLSLTMITRAAEEAQQRNLKINFLHADIREIEFDGTFDGVICMGTTFGFFDDEANRDVLSRLHQALKPGGRILVDVVNRDYVLSCQPNLVWFEGDECVCMEESDFNYFSSRLAVKRTMMGEDGRQSDAEYSIRLYSLHELGQLMQQMGFRVIEVSGQEATRGMFFGAQSQRILMLGERRLPNRKSVAMPPPERTGDSNKPKPPQS